LSQFQINYIQSLAYVDIQVGLLIDELKAAGLYDNSIIAIYGDHRAFMSNQNDTGFAKFRGLDKFDQVSFFTTGENVPLIVHVPGTNIALTDSSPAGHLDYAPTILGLLGINTPRTMLGQDLLSPRKPVAIQRNSAGSVEIIETPEVFYANSGDGDFSGGTCYKTATKQKIELSACKAVYDEQSALAKVSDLVVRGDALYLLK
jgi:lipoteichoic acid synthase